MAVMSKISIIVALNAIVALATPVVPTLVARQGPSQCRNQSCGIALVAGSTGSTVYDLPYYPSGDTQDGDCCIISYFPAAKSAIYKARPSLESYCSSTFQTAQKDSNPPGVDQVTVTGNVAKRDLGEPEYSSFAPIARDLDAAYKSSLAERDLMARDTAASVPCKANILIFAKGTFEPGDVGVTIGNSIAMNLDSSKWQTVGINYDNGLNNNYCLGLPGGVSARPVINQVFTACPNSQIVLGGYSQGAMVVRNAIARIPAAQASKIARVVTFGDPFCGAKIGQYSGPVDVFCNSRDGVCDGRLDISFDHLSYSAATTAAITLLKSIQK